MMTPYNAIACCIVRDEMADAVLEEGVRLCDGDLSILRIVHVVAPPRAVVMGALAYVAPLWEAVDDARAWVEGVAARLPGARAVLLEGAPVRAVSDWVAAEGIGLLIAAASRTPLERALLGGFASHLAYHAPCPVLFIQPPVHDEAPGDDGSASGGPGEGARSRGAA